VTMSIFFYNCKYSQSKTLKVLQLASFICGLEIFYADYSTIQETWD